jgi:hypothetical protein
MSKQSEVGRTLLDLRDVCSQKVVQVLINLNRELSLNVTDDQLQRCKSEVDAELHKAFDGGIDVVLKIVQ